MNRIIERLICRSTDREQCFLRGKVAQGCTDSTACNYDSEAVEDNNSCLYPDAGFNCNDEFVGYDCGDEPFFSDSIVVGTGYANNM